MMNTLKYLLLASLAMFNLSCGSDRSTEEQSEEKQPSNLVKKFREDGTLSSINPLDDQGFVHGVKVNFYEDGLTIHSKVTYEHGRKNGPAIWFFKNGKIYEHTTYYENRKNGLTRRYYETGELMEEVEFDTGEELPGKKRYSKEGELISN